MNEWMDQQYMESDWPNGEKSFVKEQSQFAVPKEPPEWRRDTVPTAEILTGKNARAWVSMVLFFKK